MQVLPTIGVSQFSTYPSTEETIVAGVVTGGLVLVLILVVWIIRRSQK
jgi:hypothetical protein